MKHLRVLFLVFSLASFLAGNAQEFPWEKYGFDPNIVTLSKGKYQEFHDLKTVVEIGSVLYNTQTKKIVGFVEKDTLYSEADLKPHIISRWISPDPLSEEYSSWSPYNYVMNNPIILVDPDGREPVKKYAGTSQQFLAVLNNSSRQVGHFKGTDSHSYMMSLGNTEMNWKQMRPLPTETGYFNTKKGRYIYTEKGGWLDMSHFMFYAGKAYKYQQEGKENPIGEAVQDGYAQELTDKYAAKHSAYSYEDLPSDKFGAEFSTKYFNPNSELTFGEQLMNYLNNELGATNPENAPNYDKIPAVDSKNPPTQTNETTKPLYTREDEQF